MIEHIGVIVIILPFLNALLCFLSRRNIGPFIGVIGAITLTILTFFLGQHVYEVGTTYYAMGGWSRPLGISLHLNGLSAIMLIFTALAGLFISIYASGYFRGRVTAEDKDNERYIRMEEYFWPLWFFVWGGLNVLFLSADLFNIYVALEIISFSAVALVALKGSSESLLAATRYFFLTLLGSLVYLFGVSFLYSTYGVLDLGLLKSVMTPGLFSTLAIALITLGLMIKTALFPMHFWLPSAHANSPAPVSAILSGLVVMGSFYLLVRLWFESFSEVIHPLSGQMVGLLASVSILGGSWMAIQQERLKMMLAYSTIAQIGYMFLLFPLITSHAVGQGFAWSGGVYFSISHACAKAAAFMVAGLIMYALGHDRISELHGLARRFPIGVFAFALAGVSLMGLPPSGGFIGKWMLLKASMLTGQWWYAVLMLVGSGLSACYIFRFLEVTFKKPVHDMFSIKVPVAMEYAALAMASIAIILGLVANYPLELLKVDSPVTFQTMKGFMK